MKKLLATIALTLLMCCLVGCQNEAERKYEQDHVKLQNETNQILATANSATKQQTIAPEQQFVPPITPAIGYDWRHENWENYERGGDARRIVELDQGEEAGAEMFICACAGDTPQLSNRHRDACDRIAAKGKRIRAQQEAAEKRKDDAYDKAHSRSKP